MEALATIANVATLLGLLGTIAGMIEIFSVISEQTVVNPTSLAHGISVALYTTAFGLSVAIPTLVGHRYLSGRADALILQMEETSIEMMELLKEKEADLA
jgi:biopolymer transport protein ExbB